MPTDNNTTQHDNNTATQYDYYYYQGRRVRRPKAEGGQFLTDHPDAMHLPSDKAGWDTQLTQWGLDPAKYPNPTFTVGSDTDLALLQKSRERSLAQHRTERQEARSGTMRPLSKEDNELPAVTITADGNGRTTTSHEREVSLFGHKFAVSDPPSASPVADAMDDASFDFSMTPEGRQLKSEMQRAADSITDRYAKEYAASPEYKQLAARAKAEGWDTARLDEEAGREFSSLYGKRIDSDWQAMGYDERWYKELNSRYGGQLAEAEKQQTAADLATVGRDIDSLYGRLAHDKEQVRMGRKGYDADTYIRWNAREAMLDAARDQYEDAQRIVDEARRDTSWGKGRKLASLGRGVSDIVGDIDTWTAGFTDLDNAQQLNTVLHKVEAGDDLTPEQTALMDALTYGMAARAAHIDDVSGWYKAGEVTGESIPFILEMLVNPLSSAGSAATKTILKYGLRRYGLRSVASASRGLARRVAGLGTRRGLSKALGAAAQGTVGLGRGLASGVARGAGMAATTGGGRVMAGAMQRQNDDYAIERADDGRYVATGGDETLGESIVRSFASTAFENASEMSGDLLGRTLGLPMHALGKAGAARAVGSWLSKSRAGQIYRAISGNTVAKTLRERAHVTGVFGEYLEEVYSNALNAAVGNGTWGEVVDPVQNVQTFLSLVPMQVGFGLLGLGGYAAQSYASARERRSIRDGASDRARSMMDMLDNTPDALIDRVVTGLSANASYTPQERETLVRYGIAVKQGRELSHAAVEMSDDDRLANDAYANGQSISSPAELHDAWLEYLAVREEASSVFSDEDMGLLETMSPGQALQHIDGKDRGLALELMSARARVNGAETGIGERARDASIAATRMVRNNTNEGSGRIVLAAMGDGSRAYVVSGSVSLNDDGSIDRGGSSESLVVRDASTGKARMADVSEISSIEADEEAGAAAEEAGRTAYDGVMRGERGAMFGIPAVGGVANLGGVPVTVTAVGDDGVHYTLPDGTASVLDEQSFVDAVVGPEVSRRMVERASVRGSGQASDGRGFDSPIQNLDSPGQGSAWRVGDGVRRGRASGTVVELPGDGTMVVEWSDGSISQMPVAEAEVMSQDGSGVEPQPVGRGLLGNIYDQFRGKAKAAIDFLTKRREGVAQAALHHKDIGDIDLAWGNSKMGLEHIVSKHPDVLDGLQERLDDMDVVEASDNRVVLESNTHKAVVSKMLGQEKTPQWLLTAYEKKDASGGSSDIVPEPQRGKQNGTAPLQDIQSTGKVSALPADMQEGDTVGGSPVALSYLLEGGKGSIGSTGYFLHGVAAAFPELTAQIEEIRSRYLSEIDPSPTGYAASGHKSIGEIRDLVNTVYGERGVEIFDRLLQNADGFVPRDGAIVAKAIDELLPVQPQLVAEAEVMSQDGSGASFIDVIRTLYVKGKEAASKLFQRSFFDVAKTPDFMKHLGLTGDKFTIRYGVISRHFGKDAEHNLPEEVWKQLPEAIQNPFAITRYYADDERKRQKGYRLYTSLQLGNGSYVVVSAEVKNAGRDIEVNAINTVFGRNALSDVHDELIYTSDTITPDQQSLLDGNNPRQYPANRESSDVGKVSALPADVQGRSLTSAEANTLIAEMEAQAEAAPEMELTPANWQREFGADGMVDTPLGKVKMGENQITKLFAKGRDAQFGMIRPTLADPDVIIEESSTSSDGTTERPSSYVFVKTFNRNGETIKFFASITVKKDGMEVSVSSHFMNKNAVARKMVDGNVMYIKEALRPISSEWHLAEHREDVPDLLPTQENNASITEDTTSTGKDTTPSGKKQGGVATSPIPRDSQGQPDYERADPDAAWDAIVEQTGGDEAMAQAVADSMVADKEAALKKAERAKPRGGVTIAEKIAAERDRKEAVERAKASLTHWQRIALTRQRRQVEAQAEQSRRAEEAARSRREQEERQRAELEEAERIRREALNGVPDIIDDTPQDARARGYRRVNGEKIDRQAPLALPGDVSADAVNRQFNDELQRQVDGTLPKGHIYRLGRPGGVLLSTGFPDLPIELSSTRLEEKSRQRNHEFDIADVRDLAKAINNPLAVFSYGNKDKAQNVVVEIERGGKKFVVGISLNPVVGGRNLEVNSIRGLFPKDNAEWLNWIAQGKLLYVDKQKIQALMSQQRTILADVGYLDLDAVANIVKNFENPDISIGNGAILGNEVHVKFDDQNIPAGRVALIEASRLQPSHINGQRNPLHFIDEAQPKERNDEASVLSARRMAANIRPEEITSSVTAYTGAPTVNVRGEVIQGNNRSAALREMWAGEPAQAQKYKQYLTDHAADFGLTPEDVEAMRRPVLVSMVDVSDDEAITLGQFVAQDTESGGTERIKPRNVVQRMGGDMRSFASRLLSSSNDEMTFSELVDRNGMDVLKWMQQRGHISPTQYRSAFDNRGNLTAEAKNDLRGIMYQSIFQNGNTHLEEMFGTLPAKAQKAILATAYRDYDSPNAERMNAELQASISAYHALSQMPDFASAKNYREARLAAQTWQRQYAIDDVTGESYLPSDRYSNFAVLLAVMYKGQTQSFIQNTLDGIFDLVQGTQEATLFEQPDNTPRTLAEAINEAINARGDELLLNGKFTYDGQRRSNVLAGGSAASQQGRQGSTGDAPAGGRAEDATRQADSPSGVERNSGQLRNDGKRQNALSEVSSAERIEMESRIVDWLSDDNLAKASGKSREDIFKEFGNEPMPIAYIPERFMPLAGDGISDPRIYCGKGYFIEHALRNHAAQGSQMSVDDVDVSKYLNIQSVLDNPDHIKETFVDGKRTVVFIKKIGRYFAELTQVEENGKIILHKSLFNQKKEPYAKLDDIRHKYTSSEGGVSSISHADGTAPAISLQSRDDVKSSRKSKPTNSRTDVDNNLNGVSDDTATQHSSDVSESKETDKLTDAQAIGEKLDEKPFATVKTKRGIAELRRATSRSKDGMSATRVVATRNGREVSMPTASMPLPDIYAMPDISDSIEVVGAREIRELKGKTAATVVVRHEDGTLDTMETRLVPKDETEAVNDAQPLSLADMQQGSEPAMRQVDVEGLMQAINRDGEAKLSDHFIVGKPGLTERLSGGNTNGQTSNTEAGQTNDTYGADNRLVSRARYEELKKRMRQKLGGQMNMGIDPEILAIGTEMAAYHIEAGARRFADYARRMIADLGDAIRPYLKSFYNGARDLPEVQEAGYADEMTPYEDVRAFDVANFDRGSTDAFATAEMVVAEQEAGRQAEKAKSEIINRRNNERRKENEQTAADTEAVAGQAEAVASKAESRIEAATDEKQVNETVEEIDSQLDKVNEQLALLGYYDADQVEGDFNEAYGYMRNAEKKAVKDANRLANRLVKDLGIDPKAIVDKKGKRRRSIAVANIAPIGGDISIYLPLGDKRELYINIQLDKQNGDNLKAKGGYVRIENPNPERGEERYLSSNNFFADDETYQSLLRKVQQLVKHYVTDFVPKSNTQQEVSAKAERKQGKRQRKQEEPKIADLFSAQEEYAVENQENSPFQKGDAVIYHGKPATVYDFDDDGRLVLDTGLAPVLYDIADPKEVKPANTASPNVENAEINRTFANAVKTDMLVALDSGTRPYRSILDLRKRAASLGMEVDNDGRTDILLQELVEDGLVRAAREVVEQHGRDSRESYDLICKLYDMQPTIAARSSNRIKMQQYSTPLPMAWNAAHFAMSGKKDGKVLEPTAGNGMLVFSVPAQQVHANELDETRLDNLREQGFAQVTRQDAADPFEGGQQYDVIIANPPFGKREEVEYDGKMIPGLDPQITLNALASMKDDGKAAIIIGGNMEYGNNGGLKSMKPFFTYLYDHYNVKGVVDMDGRLYAKQGTTYPTRMILIAGRRSDEERAQTAVYPPVESKAIRKAESFDDLYEIVNEVINSKEKTNGTEILRSQQGQLVSVADRPSRNTDGKRHTGQSRTDDTSGRGRRASVEGPQEQSEVVLRGEHRTDTGDGETRRGTGGNTTGGSRGVPEPDVQRVDRVGVSTNRVGLSPEPKKRNLTEEKLPYRPHNSAFSLESVAPAAMVEAMDNVLSQIEAENGNIDEFVKKELGYDTIEETHQALAAEQIDSVAMAIYQMKKGQALIIGDQTGVGKGRQMAALIRWAVKRGEKPIFITQKADLFSDIYRDLVDIGSGDLVPFIFNSPSAKENKGEMVDANGKVVYKGLSDAKMKKVMATGKLPDEYDYAVLTYSQVNSGDEISQKEAEEAAKKRGGRTKKSKASKDGKATPKATFLRAIAEDNYLFLDESHTAAGTSNTGAYLQSILRSAKAATFASATFAKRPDTMPLYAIRTAMSQAKVEPDKLIGIIEKGGVTLQEIMSRELTNAGQMVRRERDMSDVVTDWKTITDPVTVKRSRENYDRTIAAFNAIIKFQEDYVKPMVDAMDKELAVMAESAGIKRGTDKLGISNVPFASKTYNYTKQLMLALKVDAIVNEVDTEIKAGRHPVIALESTMESSIKDYSAGEVIEEPTFSASLLRGLDTVMQYTIKDENGKEQHARYSPKQLGEAGEKAYYELQDFIRKSTSDIFISPLDAIIERLHGIGYKVGELTGRDMYVERDDEGRVVVKRRTDKDKKKMQREFNNGTLDVLILNKSASTGISLHASEKFSDQRQRTMIIAQPLSDINDYMQMIGRIDRTGQVHRGYYINLGLPVPAENRFLMMLSTKLKSLNANTTTSQDSESNDVEAPDLLNKYGSQVVVEYLRDNPEIYEKMGSPLKKSGEGSNTVSIAELEEYKPQEDDARKITGYVALLTTKEQEEFYDDVVRRYNELIKYLNDTGSNDLKITVMPLRAKTLSKRVSSEGIDPTGTNPFARNSYVERVEMDVLRKPMKAAEIRKTIAQVNKGKRPEDYIRQVIATIEKEDEARVAAEEARYERSKVKAQEDIAKQTDKINRQQKRTAEEKQAAIADYVRETNDNVESKHNDNMMRINTNSDMLKQRLHMFEVGKSYLMPDNLESMVFDFSTPAIFCGYKSKDSKITASTTLAVFATLDGRRRMEVKLSQPEALRNIYKATNDNWDAARSTTLENWDSQIPTGTRKTGFIMTGNILQAIADTQDEHGGYPGQLISYTDIDGNVHDGILMPDKWNTSMLKTSGAPIISRLKQIKDYMPVTSHDGKVDITGSSWAKVYYLTVPKTKKDGAVYYENKTLLDAVHGHNFYPYRGKLRADITAENIERVVRELSKLGVRVKEETNEDDALYRLDDELAEVNERFNEQLDGLTEENADSVTLSLGRPSAVLRAAGVEDKPMKLYGNKVMKKMRKHGFTLPELRDLPRAVADPIAVFKNYGKEGNRSILTELRTEQGNFLVTLTLGEGHDVDFNIVTSVFGKGGSNIVDWINKGFATYINKEKALDYLHHSALKAVTSDSQELVSAANVVRNFENPGINGEETYRDVYRLDDDELGEVNERFNEELRRYDSGEMDTNEMFHLGMPQGVMRAFLPDLPIVMRQRVAKKGAEKKHNVPTSALQDMPSMISDPIFVFQRDANTIGILTDMTDNDGKNVCVAIELGRVIQNGGEYLEVNDIRSFHGREVKYIIEPIAHNNTLRYANKEKGLAWLSSASQPVQQEIDKQDLIDAANIVRNFENPSFNGDNLREGVGELSDDDLSIANDPVSKLLGKSTRTAAQRRAFAEKERQRMVDAVQDLAAKLHLDNVEVVTDASTLDGRRAKAKGFYSRSTGRITIVIPNHTSVYDAEQTLLHEAVAHYGLRELFGEHFDTFLDNVFQSADSDVRRRITELARERNWDFRTATEEYLASLAEETNFEAATRSGWWQKIKDAFMRMLHSIGFENFSGVTLSDNELRYILWRSYENLAEPGRYRSILGEAEDVAKQYELKVGNYAPFHGNIGQVADVRESAKAKRIEKLRNSKPVGITGNEIEPSDNLKQYKKNALEYGKKLQGEYTNKDTGITIRLQRGRRNGGINEVLQHDYKDIEHLQSTAAIPHIIENSIYIDTRENIDVEKNPDVKEYQYYVCGLKIGNVDYTVRSTVAVDKNGNRYYDHKLTHIEKGKLLDLINSQAAYNNGFGTTPGTKPTTEIFSNYKDKILLSILQADGEEKDLLFREADTPQEYDKAIVRERYDRRVRSFWYNSAESMFDSMQSLKEAMQMIVEAETGGTRHIEEIAGFENAYLGENRLSSKNEAEGKAVARHLFKPLLDEAAKLAKDKASRTALYDYMMAKHGLERNRVMALREAQKAYDDTLRKHPHSKKTLQDFIDEYRDRDFAGLTGLTGTENVAEAEAEARRMVDEYEAAHDTDALWARVRAVTDYILDKSLDTGLLSREGYDRIKGMYTHYIPLRGFAAVTSPEAYTYLDAVQTGAASVIKEAGGRTTKADDPLAQISSMLDSVIMQGNRNQIVKQRFLNFVLNHPSDLVSVSELYLEHDEVKGEWRAKLPELDDDMTPSQVSAALREFDRTMSRLVAEQPGRYRLARQSPDIPYVVPGKATLREHQVLVRRGGRTVVLTINGNPRLAQALNGATNPDGGTGMWEQVLRIGESVNRQLAAFYTTRRPDFVLSNFLRDAVYTNTMAYVKEGGSYGARFNVNFGRFNPGSIMRLIVRYEAGRLDESDETERLFRLFMDNGGETGYAMMRDMEAHKRAVTRALRDSRGLTVAQLGKMVGGYWDIFNRGVENCARFAAFVTSMQSGRSLDRSIWDAKEISVNFNKKGSGFTMFDPRAGWRSASNWVRFASGAGRSGYVFWNAALQGTSNFTRATARHPVRAVTAMAAMYLLGTLAPVLASMFGSGDDDDDYYDLPDFVRRTNWVIPTGGHGWICIPLPVEYRAIYGLGELSGTLMGGEVRMDGAEIAMEVASQLSQLMPINLLEGGGGSHAWHALVPSAVAPIVEIAVNRDWLGLPVYKDTPYNKEVPEWRSVYRNTNELLVSASRWLNDASGGNDVDRGTMGWLNPAAVEHLLGGYLGGYATTVGQMVNMAGSLIRGEETDVRNVPLLNRVYKRGTDRTEARHVNEEYWKLVKEAGKTTYRLRGYREEAARGVTEYAERIVWLNRSPEYARYAIMRPYMRAVKRMEQARGQVAEGAQADSIDNAIIDLKRQAVEACAAVE